MKTLDYKPLLCGCTLCLQFIKHQKKLKERHSRPRPVLKLTAELKAIRLQGYADQLEAKKHKSDEWLKRHWEAIRHKDDYFNSPEGPFIPDLINRKFKYLVECDGSSHDSQEARAKDRKRDLYFAKRGYSIYRVKFMDMYKIDLVKQAILRIRAKTSPKTILIKALENR